MPEAAQTTVAPFIPPGLDVTNTHPGIQNHLLDKSALRSRWSSEQGKIILNEWASSGYDRDKLDNLVGRLYGKSDLRGVPLSATDVSRKDLSNIDFYGAIFRRSNLTSVRLDGAYLSEADLRGAKFAWASMRDVLIDNPEYDTDTDFLGVALQSVNFNLSALLQEQAQTQQRIAHLKRRHPILACFLSVSCDYGRSLSRWMAWVGLTIILFAIAYGLEINSLHYTNNVKGVSKILDFLYFSFITFTTLGYGDIVPVTTLSKVTVITEVSVGYVMGGLLVAILAKRLLGN